MNLPVGAGENDISENVDELSSINLENLPNGIVTGSTLLEFSAEVNQTIKSSVALCLLAAQRVASRDSVVTTPDDWIERHNTVLRGLGWLIESGGLVNSEFKNINLAVHEAIIPFLMTALGPTAAVGSLIIKALEQLKTMDDKSKWITLFEKQSRRFDVSEFHFAVVETEGNQTRLRIAAARFDAKYGKTQVLFFKLKNTKASFVAGKSSLLVDSAELERMNAGLQIKLNTLKDQYIEELDLGV